MYGGAIVAELGRLLNNPVPDFKGLSIKKTTMSRRLREQFQEILFKDILLSPSIDLKNIIRKFDDIGIEIEKSLRAGELVYSIPKSIEIFDSYKNPSTLEAVRGAIVWNAIEPDSPISPPEKVNIIKLKAFDKNHPEFLKLKETYPNKYQAIMSTVFNEGLDEKSVKIDISRFGFSVVAMPKSIEKIPEYLLPFIDYQAMINNNMTNGYILLESLGVYTQEVDTIKYKSNIVEI